MMENNNRDHLNPWITMWIKPRATIQQIVDTNPERKVHLLAAAAGFSQYLDRASEKGMGDIWEWPMIFMIAMIVGPIGGMIFLYIGGALIRWTGNWVGGQASSQDIRAAIAWSSVPIIWALILWIPELVLFGQDLFTTEGPRIDADPSLVFILFGFGAIHIIVAIWSIVVFLKCLGQVQGFSAWKALGNAILTGLIIFVPIAIVSIGIAVLIG
jgi:hypothetical protein